MAIDLVKLAEEHGVAVDADNPAGTMEKLLEAMRERSASAEAKSTEATDRADKLMDSLEKALAAIGQREELHENAGVQGHQALGVDPGGKAAAQMAEEAGFDPERSKQLLSDIARAKSFPDDLTPLRHPIYDRVADDETTKALHEQFDHWYLISRVLGKPVQMLRSFRAATERSEAFREFLNKTPNVRFADDDRDPHALSKALQKSATDALVSDSSAAGGSFSPDGWSASVWADVRLKCVLSQQFQTINMPTRVFYNPYMTGSARCYLTSQATDMTPHAFDTGSATLTAKGFGAAMEFSGELDEDSLAPVAPMVIDDLTTTLAESLETAIINGDDATTHMDTCVTADADCRKAWDGLRYLTYAASLTESLATLTIENVRKLTAGMGKYGVNPDDCFWCMSPKAVVKFLSLKDANNYPMVQTLNLYGPQATVLSGRLLQLDGSPIIVSGQYPEYMTTAGIYGDTGGDPSAYTNTSILKVNKRMFLLGERRAVRIEDDRFIQGDYTLVVGKARWAWAPKIACSSSYKCAYSGIALAT